MDRSSRSGPVRSLTIRRSVPGREVLATHLRLGKIGGGVAWRLDDVTEKRKLVLQTSYLSRTMVPGSIFPGSIFSALICWPDGGKTPRKGVEKAIFGGNRLRGS